MLGRRRRRLADFFGIVALSFIRYVDDNEYDYLIELKDLTEVFINLNYKIFDSKYRYSSLCLVNEIIINNYKDTIKDINCCRRFSASGLAEVMFC